MNETTETGAKTWGSPLAEVWDHEDLADLGADFQVAFDAWLSHSSNRMAVLVGMACTISIGSDRYASKVAKVTRTTITTESGKTFRCNKWGQWKAERSFTLRVGKAEAHRDPSY